MSRAIPFSAPYGAYPEQRRGTSSDARSARQGRLLFLLRHGSSETAARFVQAVREADERVSAIPDSAIGACVRAIAAGLRASDTAFEATTLCFALTRCQARAVLGFDPHDEQIAGAWHLLNGKLVEMETGEGKTVTAVFTAVAQALAGSAVHIITTNDYLAGRDAAEMGPIFERVGLSVGCVKEGMESSLRRAAYASAITYVTPKQLMFDYLRDRIELGSKAGCGLRTELEVAMARSAATKGHFFYLRGLQAAIVDEADSVLIDEAVVPLIISRQEAAPDQQLIAERAVGLASELVRGRDFLVTADSRDIVLTPAGRDLLANSAKPIGGVFASQLWREQYILQALMALHLFRRDREYITRDGAVEIVDINTGRTMPDRSWERGLHQMIQAKEGLAVTTPNEAMARISHQDFFCRYHFLCGMSGTIMEVAREIRHTYGLRAVRIPTHRPLRRRSLGVEIHVTAEAKHSAIAERVRQLLTQSRPVLIGTRTVADSEQVSEELTRRAIPHTLLNARHDASEAEIIAAAGRVGAVTVATNMAGRGTDIRVEPQALAVGGLHVIASERHESRRIDRQLFGRTARQGDLGTYEEIVSLEDQLMRMLPPRLVAVAKFRLARRLLISFAQWRASRHGVRLRRDLARYEREMHRALSFAGAGEGTRR
jgi:preprotein translocase subunit SecA